MNSQDKSNLIDEEMEQLIDNAIASANVFAMENAKQFQVLDSNIKEVIEDSESFLRDEKRARTDVGMSLIFVSEEAIEHLKYVQNLREFLQMEASRMVKEIMEKRSRGETTVRGKKAARSGKKCACRN